MTELYHTESEPQRVYWDKRVYTTFEEQEEAIKTSSTLYVGNLNFRTNEAQLDAVFARVGPIKKIIMGINQNTKEPCGFAFVEYKTRDHALSGLKYLNGTHVDESIVRLELDAGFKPNRRFGRGQSGGQVRDEKRGKTSSLKYGNQHSSNKGGSSGGTGGGGGGREGSSGSNAKRGRDDEEQKAAREKALEEKEKEFKKKALDLLHTGLSTSRGTNDSKKKAKEREDDDDLLAELEQQPTKKRKDAPADKA
jgi:nuclear cap-binding protein subunit 2